MHARTTDLAALPQPRHVASAAADVVASHRALDEAVLSIEGARTHAPTVSTGALAVFVRFSTPSPGPAAVCSLVPGHFGCSIRHMYEI
jgi:hypothetical protein